MYAIKVVQALSGLTFASFSTLHLAGHVLANFSFRLADQALFANREIFQSPVVELGIIGGSLIVHALSSAWLFSKRPKQRESSIAVVRSRQKEIQLHRYSGYCLAGLMCTHIPFTRIFPLIALDDPSILNLSFVTESFGLKIMYPYYILLGTAGLYHTCYGIIQSLHVLKISRFQLKPGSWIFWSKVFTGVMISTILALAGFYEYIPSDMHDVNVQVSRVPFALVGLDYSLH